MSLWTQTIMDRRATVTFEDAVDSGCAAGDHQIPSHIGPKRFNVSRSAMENYKRSILGYIWLVCQDMALVVRLSSRLGP